VQVKLKSNTNPIKKPGMDLGAPEGYAVPAPHVDETLRFHFW